MSILVNPFNIKPDYKDKFYVYALCKPCGSVFYIGKGINNRVNQHFHLNHLNRSDTRKNNVIRKYGNTIKREILCYFDSEESAYDYEEWLISCYGLIDEGGVLCQYAKNRNQYSKGFSIKASSNSQTKTTIEQEYKVRDAYISYYTLKKSKHEIASDLNVKYSTLRSWLNGTKYKHLYRKYILSGLIQLNRQYDNDYKLSKDYDLIKMKELRLRWVSGESTGELAKEVGITTSTLKDLFVGNSAKGMFDDYTTYPTRYLKRKNRGKWLEDKIS